MSESKTVPTPEPFQASKEDKSQLDAAIIQVMRRVPYVQKRGQIKEGGNYTYAKEADFIEALNPAMCDAGITAHVAEIEIVSESERLTSNNKRMFNIKIMGSVQLTHAPSGQTKLVKSFGEGQDTGDKGLNKAMTGMMKYALRQTFLIATGDDPDDHANPELAGSKTVANDMITSLRACNASGIEGCWGDVQQDRKLVSDEDWKTVQAAYKEMQAKFDGTGGAKKTADNAGTGAAAGAGTNVDTGVKPKEHQLPADGKELVKRLQDYNKKLMDEGKTQDGEVIEFVLKECGKPPEAYKKGNLGRLRWNPEEIVKAVKAVATFAADLKKKAGASGS